VGEYADAIADLIQTEEQRSEEDIFSQLDREAEEKTQFGLVERYAFAALCAQIVEHGYNVITQQRVREAASFGSNNYGWSADSLTFQHNIQSLISQAGFREVKPQYLRYSPWRNSDDVMVAPVVPEIDKIIEDLGDPVVTTTRSIINRLLRYYTTDVWKSSEDFCDRAPEVSIEDVAAFRGWVESELDERGWADVSAGDTQMRIWLDLETIEQELDNKGPVVTDSIVYDFINRALMIGTPEFRDDTLRCENLSDIKLRILRRYDWYTIEVHDTTYWYSSQDLYRAELDWWISRAKRLSKDPEDANVESFQEAIEFLDNNTVKIQIEFSIEKENIKKLKGVLEAEKDARERTAIFSSEYFVQDDNEDPINAGGDLEAGSEAEAYMEFQHALEAQREAEADDDGSSDGGAIDSYSY